MLNSVWERAKGNFVVVIPMIMVCNCENYLAECSFGFLTLSVSVLSGIFRAVTLILMFSNVKLELSEQGTGTNET